MYTITIKLNDETKIGPRQLDTTLEAAEFKEEVESNPRIREKFLTAFVELPPVTTRDAAGRALSGVELVNLATYEEVIAFLGRHNG